MANEKIDIRKLRERAKASSPVTDDDREFMRQMADRMPNLSIRHNADPSAHLEEVYGLRISADLISRVTDAVLEEVSDWQNRALEPVYPLVFLDALRVKIRDAESRQVKNKAVYVALGVTPKDGDTRLDGGYLRKFRKD